MALPDYPSLKKDISELLLGILEAASDRQLGPFAKSPRIRYHEGDQAEFSTVSGEVKEVDFKDFSFGETLDLSSFSRLSTADVFESMVRVGTRFGAELAKGLFEHLSKELDEAGQTISAGGRPLDAELLLEAYKGLDIEFDDTGQPQLQQMVVGSEKQREAIRRIFATEPEFVERFNALIEQKREEWLARESNRKLVD